MSKKSVPVMLSSSRTICNDESASFRLKETESLNLPLSSRRDSKRVLSAFDLSQEPWKIATFTSVEDMIRNLLIPDNEKQKLFAFLFFSQKKKESAPLGVF